MYEDPGAEADTGWLFKRGLTEVVEDESCGGWLGAGRRLHGGGGMRTNGMVK